MTAVLSAQSGPWSSVVVPEWFRLRDENPFTLRPYAVGRGRDLPPYISDAIESALGLTPRKWDQLVNTDRVLETVDVDQPISLRGFLHTVRTRRGSLAPRWMRDVCEDCWGTCAVSDPDGSLSGERGAVVLCGCTFLVLERRPRTSDTRLRLTCHERGWL